MVDPDARMDSIPKWFSGVKVNFAENILFSAGLTDPSMVTTAGKEDDKVACTEAREGCTEIKHFTWKQLRERVARLSQAMRAHGVKKGDRVAVVASNSIDTLTVLLAVTTLGGLFTSSSTDMGSTGILDRLRQINPRWVFVDDWAVYNGKSVDLRGKMAEVVRGMRDVAGFQGVVSIPRFQAKPVDISKLPRTMTLAKFLEARRGKSELLFERADFCDPFLIVYSSGTTGIPKCIVHSIGGVLMNGNKEGRLHKDTRPDTVNLQYTTVSRSCPPQTAHYNSLDRPVGSCIFSQ